MSDYIVTDTELTETADAIRAKTGDSNLIEWESGTGFADAVAAISGGSFPPSGCAVISITTDTGSTVTVTSGSYTETLNPNDSISNDEKGNTYIFAITSDHFGSFTISSSLNGNVATIQAEISSAAYYEISLFHGLYFIYNGAPRNGGLPNRIRNAAQTYVDYLTGVTRISVTYYSNAALSEAVDLTNYNILHISVGSLSDEGDKHLQLASNINGSSSSQYNVRTVPLVANQVVEMDVSSYSGVYYIGVLINVRTGTGNAEVYDLWLT